MSQTTVYILHDSIQEYREFLHIKRSKDANGIIIMFINFHFSTFMQMSHKHRICRKGKGLDSVRWLLLKGKSNARTSAYSWILARAESIRQGQLRQNTYGQCPIRSNIIILVLSSFRNNIDFDNATY